MKPRRDDEYARMVDTVHTGVACGLRRYYKYRNSEPDEEILAAMIEAIQSEVMNQICEDWVFDEEKEEGDE